MMPPQLQLSLLNVPPAMDAIAALPRPQHVILNHIYLQRMTTSTNAMVLGTTHRYRSKYVTTVMVVPKPRHRQPAQPGSPLGGGTAQPAVSDVSMSQAQTSSGTPRSPGAVHMSPMLS